MAVQIKQGRIGFIGPDPIESRRQFDTQMLAIRQKSTDIDSVEDMKVLYSGFDLTNPMTSVSMTINGPAPMLLAFFLNAAIDQQYEKKIVELGLEKDLEKIVSLSISPIQRRIAQMKEVFDVREDGSLVKEAFKQGFL